MNPSQYSTKNSHACTLALFIFFLLTVGALYYINIESQGLQREVSNSITDTQHKTYTISNLSHNIQSRSYILLTMLNEEDPFVLDELNQKLDHEAFLFRKNRDTLKNTNLTSQQSDDLNQLLTLTASNAENQVSVANLLIDENRTAATSLLFQQAIPNQTVMHAIIENFIASAEAINLEELDLLKTRINKNYETSLILTIFLSFLSFAFILFLIQKIKLNHAMSADKDIISNNVIESALDAIVLTSDEELITVFNKGASDLFGYAPNEIINRPISLILPKDLSHQLSVWVKSNSRQTGIQREGYATHKDQSTIPVQVTLSDTGIRGPQRFSLIIRDLSTHKENELRMAEKTSQLDDALAKYKELSETDPLTKIPNRRAYEDRLVDEINISKRSETPLAMIVFDIDCFKEYNDYYGHDLGDIILKQIAEVIVNTLPRSTDFAARFGGEEFVVILPATDTFGAYQVAERIRLGIKALGIQHGTSSMEKVVTISAGVATLEGDALNDVSLFKYADIALYKAKEEGKNRTHTFTSNDVVILSKRS